MNVDYYNGLKKVYFDKIIDEIIEVGDLHNKQYKILDFGCGIKRLQKKLGRNILNYDTNKSLSDKIEYKDLVFDIVIFNHVLMYMDTNEIELTIKIIKEKNPKCKFIFGIGKESLLNKFCAILSMNFKAHYGTKTNYLEQILILKKNINNLKFEKNIFYMTDIYSGNCG